jgi:hypothetical protein
MRQLHERDRELPIAQGNSSGGEDRPVATAHQVFRDPGVGAGIRRSDPDVGETLLPEGAVESSAW